MKPPADAPAPNILVVDDTSANLQLLATMLKGHGYRVRPVTSGEMALRAVEAQAPDLILLDINMPEMDGYEVCRRLKADTRWRNIPVLFISALNETEDKVRAFQAGGVDYVGKPFQFEEIDARVRTHLQLRQQQLKVEETNRRLQELESMRDNLVHMIVHDMRSPLMALQMTFELLDDIRGAEDDDESEMLRTARRSVATLVEMVAQILDISRMEVGEMRLGRQQLDIVPVANEVINILKPLTGKRKVVIKATPPVMAFADGDVLRRVITNLLGNAIKFTPDGCEIVITAEKAGSQAVFSISDSGPGIDPSLHERVFDKYAQIDSPARKAGAGLGLTFVKMAVEAHGGSIRLASAPGKGCTFTVTLPEGA